MAVAVTVVRRYRDDSAAGDVGCAAMADSTTRITVEDNETAARYEAIDGGEVTGFARYSRRGGRTIFVHTEVSDGHEGEGIGSALVAAALDAERAAERPVVPLCPFVRAFIERHTEYADLVDYTLLAAIDGD
jgi:predicted GNAT family acetyltransferase